LPKDIVIRIMTMVFFQELAGRVIEEYIQDIKKKKQRVIDSNILSKIVAWNGK
jgi:hypothetical protein